MIYEFCKNLNPNFEGTYATFTHRKLLHCKGIYFDVREYINKNQDKWLKILEEWHANLCELGAKNTKYWWLINGSRFCTWSPPIYSPFLFAVAIKKYCDDFKISHISLLDCPEETYRYLKEIDPFSEFILQNNFKLYPLNKSKYWGRVFKNILHFFYIFLNSFRHFFLFGKKLHEERILIFSQLFDSIIEKDISDHFFGEMFSSYEEKNGNKIMWLFQYNLSFKSKSIKKKLLEEKNFKIIQQFNNPLDTIKIFLIYLNLLFFYKKMSISLPSINFDGIKSYILPNEYFSFLINGVFPIEELLIYNTFNKILKNNKVIDYVIYPYEEKSIERAILLSVKNNSKSIVTIGYSHSVHWNVHYYFHIRQNKNGDSPRPDIYAVTGLLEKWWLCNVAKIPEEKIKVLGSSRHTTKIYTIPDCCFNDRNMNVFIAVGQSSDLKILANYMEEKPHIFKNCNLLIRKYPFDWEKEQEDGISRIRKYVSRLRINNAESLETQIKWCDITLYNSSSCGIIAMLSGRIAINVALHDIFYWNPLEKDGSKNVVIHCKTATELNETINRIKKFNSEKYSKIQKKQFSYANNVYSPINNKVLNKLFK